MKILLVFLGLIGCTSSANILLEMAALRVPHDASVLECLLSGYTILGLSFFASGAVVYLSALGSLSLTKAQLSGAASFILTALTAFITFHEQSSLEQWMGMDLFAIGMLLVGSQ